MWSGRGTRKEFVIVAVLQVVSGAAGGVQLILVKNLLDAILSAGRAARGGPMRYRDQSIFLKPRRRL